MTGESVGNPFRRRPAPSDDAGRSPGTAGSQHVDVADAFAQAARERGIPVIRMSPADMVRFGPEFLAQLGIPSAEDLIAAGRFADARAECADEVTTCRKVIEAVQSQGGSPDPETAQALDARIARALGLMGLAEAGTRDFGQALPHTAEALEIARPLAVGDDPANLVLLADVLTAFASARAAARTDVLAATDAVAEAIAILDGLVRQAPEAYQRKLAAARDLGAGILTLLAEQAVTEQDEGQP